LIEVSKVKKVGPKTVMLLNKLNIYSVLDLATHFPYRYDLIKRSDIKLASEEDRVIIDGKVDSIPILIRLKNNLNKMNLRLVTSDGSIVGVSIFNRAYLKKDLEVGANITVIGKYEKQKNIVVASEIRMGLLPKGEKIEPVYHGTVGLNSKSLSMFINNCLMDYGNDLEDFIPKYLIEKYNFLNKKTALNIVHNPPSYEKLKEAMIRLKYEELFCFMTKINYLKLKNKTKENGISKTINHEDLEKIINKLPFKLTEDQNKVLNEILDDLDSPYRMNRLLQGDVGSGKTIIAILAMYACFLSGYTSALMAPTEILATQHYNNIKKLFGDSKIKVELLTGSMTKKEKDEIHKKLEDGEIDIIVGTHALIQEGVTYKNLGLVVTDEQHRFGVLQRTSLQNKGIAPDILYMSATPIPRTYALTIYGDMDISTIKTLPSGRKKVETYLKKEQEIKDVLKMMYDELLNNHQIYVIAPLIEESEQVI